MQIRTIASSTLAFALAFACSAHAAPAPDAATGKPGKPLSTQQARMKDCNAEAKSQTLKGEERRTFMSTCLKGGATSLTTHGADKPAAASQVQLKRKACSAEAKEKGLKGDQRKAFVHECASEGQVASVK